jgi:hypothetical protein
MTKFQQKKNTDTIAQDDFHVGWEQLHVLPSTTFNSSYQRIDIVGKIG